jgi:hypothetical protein
MAPVAARVIDPGQEEQGKAVGGLPVPVNLKHRESLL